MKIICGGQTGVDRAALDVARQLHIPYGGWVPKGRAAEDGAIGPQYENLVEAQSSDPAERTRLNVEAADATLIIKTDARSDGTDLTAQIAKELGKKLKIVDISNGPKLDQSIDIRAWLSNEQPSILNVAGPRESEAKGIYQGAVFLLTHAIESHSNT